MKQVKVAENHKYKEKVKNPYSRLWSIILCGQPSIKYIKLTWSNKATRH